MDRKELSIAAQELMSAQLSAIDPSTAITQSEAADALGTMKEQAENEAAASAVATNPVEAISEEVAKAKRAPKRAGLLSYKPANDWVEESLNTPNPRTFFHGMFAEKENTVLFASSNVGKSVLGNQVAEAIATVEKLMYIDLELSSKQYQMRCTDEDSGEVHIFPANFIRAEIDPELIIGADLEQEILDSIEEAAKQGTKFFVIDNITFICNDSEKGATAGSFMMKLIRLKKKYGLTTIVIAHTPKRRGWEPITQNDLAGSAKLINFFDAGIAIARSAKDNNLRYLKQVKVRTGEYLYDADNVMVLDMVKKNGLLQFEIVGYEKESDHLKTREGSDGYEEIQEVLRLKEEGKTIREIADLLGLGSTTVHRRLKRAEKEGITLEKPSDDPVPSVPSVPPAEQTEQVEQAEQQRLPYKD